MNIDPFYYSDGELFVENVPLLSIAEQVGTPCYVYSRSYIESQWQAYDEAFSNQDHLVCFACKANSNIAIIDLLARLGAGFDIVSVGELERVLVAGGDPSKVIFSGVGKTEREMRRALEVGIKSFNIESEAETSILQKVAADMDITANVSFRVNPDVDPVTHPYIATGLKESKFGIAFERAVDLYRFASTLPNINLVGIACHIGSQITDIRPYLEAIDRLLVIVEQCDQVGIRLRQLNLGGGLGIRYQQEQPPAPTEFVQALLQKLNAIGYHQDEFQICLEPGRSIVGNAGLLLATVQYLKENGSKNFAIVDAAMNDFMRPALYDAWHQIIPVKQSYRDQAKSYEIVGPICESGDFLGHDRELNIAAGDAIALLSAGAYGATMSSSYNSRQRAAEVMVDNDQFHIIRQREVLDSLWANEKILPK